MNVLVFNPGSASLKFELIAAQPQATPDQGTKLVSGSIEGIREKTTFSLLEKKRIVHREQIAAADYGEAARWVLTWLNSDKDHNLPGKAQFDAVGHRVVHGGDRFTASVRIDDQVITEIEALR
jgi:acetate kinase